MLVEIHSDFILLEWVVSVCIYADIILKFKFSSNLGWNWVENVSVFKPQKHKNTKCVSKFTSSERNSFSDVKSNLFETYELK